MTRLRLRWRLAVLAGLGLAALAVLLLAVPSDHYLFLPDRARPLDPIVAVPDEPGGVADGGVYMVDVLVKKASLLERLFPQIRDGATLVPARIFNPHGLSASERKRVSVGQMSLSQQIAVAVALRTLGYDVSTQVLEVQPGSPADGKLEVGDVLVEARGARVRTSDDLVRAMRGQRPGELVEIVVRRDGRERTLEIGTRPAPDDPQRAIMGIVVGPKLPVDVRIDAGDVGGPSAGLAFALDVVDELGRDVDGGRRIAVTGELDLDGTVGRIGGVKQKTIGARRAGADVFVVPEENAAEARRYAEGLEILAVSTFDEALASLATE